MVPKMLHRSNCKIVMANLIGTVVLISMFVVAVPFLTSVVSAYSSPGKPSGYVNDFAKVLTTETLQNLENRLQSVEATSGTEIVVVTISSLEDETVETFAVKLFEEWGIGKGRIDNGLLLLVAINDGKVRIETGYGMEGVLTDLQSGRIINNDIIPFFKAGDYGGGIVSGIDTIVGIVSGDIAASQYDNSDDNFADIRSGTKIDPFTVFFIFIIVANILSRVLGKTKSWWLGGVLGSIAGSIIGLIFGFFPIGIISIILLTILGLVFDYFVSKHPPKSGHGPGGFWPIFLGGGRGGGGGFGGFGGGRSGGGGASGSW